MTERALCVHAHFYQPLREDPFTGLIPPETGATPYQNWNERIHSECYRPNAELGNFERISFNIGPTLFAWMNAFDPESCRLIVAQDKANLHRHEVGNAMAQAYHHTILPLATRQDKETQIIWGIEDFSHRFGRRPQGMWLPETAVDVETLEILAEQGIEFTILAPWQADTPSLDPTEPYRVNLPGGHSITVFFYHQELSGGVSFNPALTSNADSFARLEVQARFNHEKTQRGEPQLLMIATDGELYGHHQHFRDRFLAHLVNGASQHAGYSTSYPAAWLQKYQPRRTISIYERTSWSCHHGVTRWMGECGCTPGDGRWKGYLRQGLNRLAAAVDTLYAEQLFLLKINPWEIRNKYIQVMLDNTSLSELAGEVGGKQLMPDQLDVLKLLLEAQRYRQQMFMSCGWFFEDFSRIEPRNNVAYAAQAVNLMRKATGIDLTAHVMADLRYVLSQSSGIRGDTVFIDHLHRAAAGEHPSISSLAHA
jgi:alpha-amylase/alpha-mannosidase (GH57 family)